VQINLDKTISWLYRNGRPLDVARYEFLFLNKDKTSVEKILQSYQNEDGGFGHGLEPDSQNPNSSPIQTWMAFEIIEELHLDNQSEIVIKILDYLVRTAPKKAGYFFSTIPSNNDFPHASWWGYSEESAIWGYNPTIAIAGFIYKYAVNSEQKDFAKTIIQRAINDFIKSPSNEMHEIRAFLDMINYLVDLNNFINHQEFLDLMLKQIEKNIEKNPKLWFSTYCVRPLQFFDKPGSFGFDHYAGLAKLEASMILENMNEQGIWEVTWSWDSYSDIWPLAKRDWQSSFIVSYLKIMHDHKII